MGSPLLNVQGVSLAIALEDMDRAVVERVGPGGPEADVVFQCAYSQRYNAVKALLGGVVYSGRTIGRVPPFRYPPSPNLIAMYIGDITGIKPRVDGSGWVTYQTARIPCHFGVPAYDTQSLGLQADASGLLYTVTRFRTSAEVFSPPTGAYYYTSGTFNAKPVADASVGVIRSHTEINMTRRFLPTIPLNNILFYQGDVNTEVITFADRTFPRGCLLFVGADVPDPQFNPSDGQKYWDITFNFIGNYEVEWNEALDPSGNYALLNDKSDGTGDPPFAYSDFSWMFSNSF